jgi:Tol biopolymer transport system component
VPRSAATLLIALLAATAVTTSALGAAPTPPKLARSDRNGKIAYTKGSRVGLITPSGVPVGKLPKCSIPYCDYAGGLAWSPGGRRLAFFRGFMQGGSLSAPPFLSLFVVNANGAHRRRLLSCGSCGLDQGSSVSWSPNGSTIAVTDGPRLALVNVKTRTHRLVARCAVGPADEPLSPAWSPDGSKIAFACGDSLRVATRTGMDPHVIATVPQRQVGRLSWSPNGRTLAFTAGGITSGEVYGEIETVRADGSHLTTLQAALALSGCCGLGSPSWPPDGTRIVYVSTPYFLTGGVLSNPAEVWVMNADGTQNHLLYRSKGNVTDYAPAVWSPSGKQIAFSILTNAESGLKIINADGTDLHTIAPSVNDFAWQPLP